MAVERFLATILVTCATAGLALGDTWGPVRLTEFYSQDSSHMLKMEPDSNWSSKPGHCRATLFRRKEKLWSRYLINDHAPVQVFVANSGHYVLTMDEWHSVGKLPVVIYGHRGELVRVHSTASLGLSDDITHIEQTVSSFWWNKNSISFFGPDEETFFIRLHWGKLLLLQLRDGAVMDQQWYGLAKGWLMPEKKWRDLHDHGRARVRKVAIELLASQDPQKRATGALVCGQERVSDAIPGLRRLLDDKEFFTTNVPKEWTRVYFVRKAAKEALETMGEKVAGVVTDEPDVR